MLQFKTWFGDESHQGFLVLIPRALELTSSQLRVNFESTLS